MGSFISAQVTTRIHRLVTKVWEVQNQMRENFGIWPNEKNQAFLHRHEQALKKLDDGQGHQHVAAEPAALGESEQVPQQLVLVTGLNGVVAEVPVGVSVLEAKRLVAAETSWPVEEQHMLAGHHELEDSRIVQTGPITILRVTAEVKLQRELQRWEFRRSSARVLAREAARSPLGRCWPR